MKRIGIFVCAFAGLGLPSTPVAAQSLDVVTSPIPQGYTDTCQSYSLGFALARANVPGFTLQTVAEVRSAEAAVRAAINAEIKPGESAYNHAVWQRAVLRLTSNNYRLNRVEYPTFEALAEKAAALTGISNAGTLSGSVAFLLSQTPVMTSFSKIDGNTYSSGHIVTVFGVDRPSGPVSVAPKLLLLNSAVKRSAASAPPAYAPLCGGGPTLPGDTRYTGALRLESSYTPKTYGGRFVLFWIVRNN
ncbi:hypothetical protein ACH0BU_12775 [Sphingomonas olei]